MSWSYEEVDKNKMILLALGPTATILAYDLYKANEEIVSNYSSVCAFNLAYNDAILACR